MKLEGEYREQGSLISAARTVSIMCSGSVQMRTGCVLDRVSSFLKVLMLQWENGVLLAYWVSVSHFIYPGAVN